MTKDYKFVADKIEVRSSIQNNVPNYIVRGYAQIPNKKDIYRFEKGADGKYRTFKSMFTDHCIESIKKQSKAKKVFVDSQHELAINANIKAKLKDKLDTKEYDEIGSLLNTKQLPFSKLHDIDIDDKGLLIDTRLNPAFRDLDESHQKYFDAVYSSLKNKFLNGISMNFVNPQVTLDAKGDEVINDIDILGFSYVDQPALEENSIIEVAIRSMIETRAGEKMSDEKEPVQNNEELDKIKQELETVKTEKAKLEEDAKTKAEQDNVDKQKQEQKGVIDGLQKQIDDLKTKPPEGEAPKQQSTVKQTDQYAKKDGADKFDDKFYKENIADITKAHKETIKAGVGAMVDNTMSGFGKLINLKVDPTASLEEADRNYINDNRLLSKDDSDIVTHK